MGIEIKNQHVFIELPKERIEKSLQAIELQIIDEAARIAIRTRKGVDVDGQPFENYTPEYATFKAKAGRNTSPVDLTFSGNMLSAIQTEVKRTDSGLVGRIFFNSAREALKAAGNQIRRRFFGLSEEQVRRISDAGRNAK